MDREAGSHAVIDTESMKPARMRSAAYSLLLRIFERATPRPLSILIFHRVLESHDAMRPNETTLEMFEWQMRIVKDYFTVLPLTDAVQMLREGCLPPRSLCITFDDGYADNLTRAAPVLGELGLPATVFVASGYLDGGRMWNDTIIESLRCIDQSSLDLSSFGLSCYALTDQASRQRAAIDVIRRSKYRSFDEREDIANAIGRHVDGLPRDLMLSTEQLKALSSTQGMSIGAHTHRHPILATLSTAEVADELKASKERLEGVIGQPVRAFAYPNGRRGTDYLPEHAALAREIGFELAVTTMTGSSGADTDPFQLPRFTPWDRTTPRYLARMLMTRRRIVSYPVQEA